MRAHVLIQDLGLPLLRLMRAHGHGKPELERPALSNQLFFVSGKMCVGVCGAITQGFAQPPLTDRHADVENRVGPLHASFEDPGLR